MRKWLAKLNAFMMLAVGAACGAAGAQGIDPAQQKQVDAVFAEYAKQDSPGCALGVIRDGKLVYTRGYGLAHLEHGLPIKSDTVFDIGSTSKQFTAASILLLEQQGKLKLDDDIRKYIPELPDYGQTITIRHLVHHTSGLRDYLTLMGLSGVDFDSVTTDDDALAIIARQKELNFAPGEEHLYSNSGYFLMGVIVKRAGGKSLREFAQEHIFGPLGMTSTHFHNDHAEIVPRRAAAYSPKQGGGFSIDMSNFEQTGDGAVFTTVEDLLEWDQNFYTPKVGGAPLIAGLVTRGRLNSGKELDYATGVVVGKHRGLPTVSHGGSWGGYRAELLRFPEEKLSVACLCNLGSTNPSRLARQVAEVLLAEKMSAPEARPAPAARAAADSPSMPAAALQERAGVYRNPQTGALRRITVTNGMLRIDSFGGSPAELVPVGNDAFSVAGAPLSIEVTFEPAGKAMVVKRATDPPETERFERAEAFAPGAADLAAYAGSFYSEELDTTYAVRVKDGKLWAQVRTNRPQELRPAVRDLFVGPQGIRIEFARGSEGRVSGFTVQAGRVRNIRFARRE